MATFLFLSSKHKRDSPHMSMSDVKITEQNAETQHAEKATMTDNNIDGTLQILPRMQLSWPSNSKTWRAKQSNVKFATVRRHGHT